MRCPMSVGGPRAACTRRITGGVTGATAATWAASRYASADAASLKRSTASAASPSRASATVRLEPGRPASHSGRSAVPPGEATSHAQSATAAGVGARTATGTESKRTRSGGRSGSVTCQARVGPPRRWVVTCSAVFGVPQVL